MAGLDLKADMPINPDYHFKWEENKTSSQIAKTLFEDFGLLACNRCWTIWEDFLKEFGRIWRRF